MNPQEIVKLGWILMIGGTLFGIILFFRQEVGGRARIMTALLIAAGFLCSVKPKLVAYYLGRVLH